MVFKYNQNYEARCEMMIKVRNIFENLYFCNSLDLKSFYFLNSLSLTIEQIYESNEFLKKIISQDLKHTKVKARVFEYEYENANKQENTVEISLFTGQVNMALDLQIGDSVMMFKSIQSVDTFRELLVAYGEI